MEVDSVEVKWAIRPGTKSLCLRRDGDSKKTGRNATLPVIGIETAIATEIIPDAVAATGRVPGGRRHLRFRRATNAAPIETGTAVGEIAGATGDAAATATETRRHRRRPGNRESAAPASDEATDGATAKPQILRQCRRLLPPKRPCQMPTSRNGWKSRFRRNLALLLPLSMRLLLLLPPSLNRLHLRR